MTTEKLDRVIGELQGTREQIAALLSQVAGDQDWQPAPGQWSFRYLAAHLAACDKECLQVRVRQIAAGENPRFEFYSNDDRDFSRLDLIESLDTWKVIRQEIVDAARALTDDQLSLTGSHAVYGTINAVDYLEIGLSHDREHLQEIERMVTEHKKQAQR